MKIRYKKTGRSTRVMLATLLMAGSAAAQKVATDYDHSANFSNFKTYTWTASKNPAEDPLRNQRIIENIDRQLAAKGLQKVDGEADLHVTYTGNLKEITSLQGFGSGGRWLGGRCPLRRCWRWILHPHKFVHWHNDLKSARRN